MGAGLIQYAGQNLINDAGAYGDQYHVRTRTSPFITLVMGQLRQGSVAQTLAVIAVGQWLAPDQVNTWRRVCPSSKVPVVIVDDFSHWSEVLWWACAMTFLLAVLRIALLLVLALWSIVISVALLLHALWSVVIGIATLVGRRGLHQGAGAEHQYAKTGDQAFG